ncbi:MAG: VC0807 family protein [Rubrivivax sp.]
MTRPDAANPWIEIAVTIVVPSVVLMQASGADALGPTGALLLALAFPLAWGLNNWRRRRGFGLMAGIGLVSTVLTGGIGLLGLDGSWFAVKEAGVSALFGVAVALSAFMKKPLIHALLLHPSLFDVDRLQAALQARGNADAFARRMRQATLALAGTFAVSALLNYVLARWLVTSPSGSEAFNAELGRFTLIAWPAITLPSLAMSMALLWWIGRRIHELSGLHINDLLHGAQPPQR